MAVPTGPRITLESVADVHGGRKIRVVYTTDIEQVKKTLLEYAGLLRRKVGRDRFVGLDFEYTNDNERDKRV